MRWPIVTEFACGEVFRPVRIAAERRAGSALAANPSSSSR